MEKRREKTLGNRSKESKGVKEDIKVRKHVKRTKGGNG